MRYDKGHKELTRQRIIETASVRFRRDGIENVGVADLMKDAGLTHGGFYSHFESKEDLVRATLEAAGERGRKNFRERVAQGGLEAWIRHYLRAGDLDHPERGCHVAALAGELARHPATTRAVLGQRSATFFTEIGTHLPASIPEARRRPVAMAIFGVLIGSLQLARIALNETIANEVLEAGIVAALKLAGLEANPEKN